MAHSAWRRPGQWQGLIDAPPGHMLDEGLQAASRNEWGLAKQHYNTALARLSEQATVGSGACRQKQHRVPPLRRNVLSLSPNYLNARRVCLCVCMCRCVCGVAWVCVCVCLGGHQILTRSAITTGACGDRQLEAAVLRARAESKLQLAELHVIEDDLACEDLEEALHDVLACQDVFATAAGEELQQRVLQVRHCLSLALPLPPAFFSQRPCLSLRRCRSGLYEAIYGSYTIRSWC